MADRKKNPKQLKRYRRRAALVTLAHLVYARVLSTLVGADAYEEVEALQTAEIQAERPCNLHEAAKRWVEGTLRA